MKRLLTLALALWLVAFARDRLDAWVDSAPIPPLIHATSPEVRDRNGDLLRAYTVDGGLWRMEVALDQVDPLFFEMLIAYEDKRFYHHHGIDLIATSRAAWQVLRNGRVISGASTLTMQVARLLTDGTTGQWQGKLAQMRLALALERRLTKKQILSLYLGLAPYGGNVEGLRAAALIWLGKEPARLTPAEAALLVALPQAPESRRPDRHPDAARTARNRVLLRMARDGVIPMAAARSDQLDPAPLGRHPMPQLAPHMADRAVASGPGRHDLTLDRAVQTSLETLVTRYMTGRSDRLSAAVILADHQTGEILASVGSPDYTNKAGQGFVDMTQAQRSPGSTLKPLVYGLAFDRGLAHPETLILDAPAQFGNYAPQNFDGQYRGELPVRRALQLSLNIPVVRLTEALGPAHLMTALQKAGVKPGLPGGAPGLALSLGGVGVTPAEMTQLYAALANGGQTTPLTWRKADKTNAKNTILGPAAAWQVGHILAGLAPPASAGPPGKVAYKTGTSYGHRDAWAIGWDGRYVATVWIGRPDGTPVPGAFGGDLAAPLLFQALSRVKHTPLPAPPPETLLLSNAQLPEPLQRFGPREPTQTLKISFPPDGATLQTSPAGVPVKLRGGRAPYTLIANDTVLQTGLRRPEFTAPLTAKGFTTLAIIDAKGQASRVTIELN
ncbi:penicillin-binding protein 1C [Tropicibacter naphthalenivorans]|uniref:peptidoglycan glycosyltransferase n=1 Tax=Tropicibacter naphthalenivorans TaxID=441103 RepID=A0A0P1GED2_9RHOB|nr:penicillin-binding protein 1C [Tropicibacter naphthalenivorans]CUH79828.1 Penicillin-binding protein F [Tropicibacter naphthalenivorans]SMC75492.1 penicillin-binding protein 1C [Tropicibacter naphthalenivorans]